MIEKSIEFDSYQFSSNIYFIINIFELTEQNIHFLLFDLFYFL
jgi:hypothetical protein